MALKDSWKDLVDGESEVEAKPINDIAKAVINIEKSANNKQIFANALIGSASGEVVALKDVSPLEHGLGVRVSSKNLFDGVWESGIISGTNGANVAVDGYIRAKNYIPVVYGEKYVFSNGIDNSVSALIYEYTEGFAYNLTNNIVLHANSVYTPSKPTTKFIRFRFNTTAFPLDTTAQLEKGTTATAPTPFVPDVGAVKLRVQGTTEYEPYIEPVEYAVNADGTVEGVKSIYPATTLTTDTVGALIEVDYNRDINKAFAELQQAIISLGGNV